jgi:hypothetical protein
LFSVRNTLRQKTDRNLAGIQQIQKHFERRTPMNLKLNLIPTLALSCATLAASPAFAQNNANTQVGMLRCTVGTSIGLLVGSRKKFVCTFTRSDGSKEQYTGRATRIGLDIGWTSKSIVSWAVFAPSQMEDAGALEGKYGGVGAQATLGVGIGVNALVGGKNVVTLQPFSVSGQTGLNIAAGFGGVTLVAVPQ